MGQVLKLLIEGAPIGEVIGDTDIDIASIGFDSRGVSPGGLFVAVRGTQSDGHAYIDDAIAKGAAAILCEELPKILEPQVTYLRTDDSSTALGYLACAFYGHPSRKLKLAGVTGTNGKTTTVTLLYDLFRKLGHKAGLISTVAYCIDDERFDSTHTTPDALTLNRMLAEMVDKGCEYCFMEVSSHSVVQRRIEGLEFVGGLFTNITHDHLDYHGTFAEYIKAKKRFFDGLPSSAFALVNSDDKNAGVMVQNCRAKKYGFSTRSFADFHCKIVEMHLDGMLLAIDGVEVWVKFLGKFNASNLLGVYAAATLLGVEKETALRLLSELTPVSGRFEYVRSNEGVTAIIDYAHTPDALQNVINTINEIRGGGQKLITVVGCGGNRDKAKRPVMAQIASAGSDVTILTSDNPRFEKAGDILKEMEAGITKGTRVLTIADRREAIKTAAMLAAPGDTILIAGKGHEDYQIIEGVKYHFDDKEEISNCFKLSS